MNILVLDSLINQKVSPEVFKMLRREYSTLASEEHITSEDIDKYLGNKRVKKFNNINIWKFRLNDEYRVFYSRGKYFSSFPESEKESLVLIWCCTDHERQGDEAKNKNFLLRDKYENISELVKDLDSIFGDDVESSVELSEEDYNAAYDLVNYAFNQRTLYRVFRENEKYDKPLDELEKGLTEEQSSIYNAFINKKRPTLVLGGAGTGKTFIAERIVRSFLESDTGNQCVYFTQSSELLNKVRTEVSELMSDYEEVITDKDKNLITYGSSTVEFRDLNDYCISKLNLDESNFVRTDEFISKFMANSYSAQNVCKNYNLDPAEVWTEIRGVIKGSMTDDWTRPGILFQDQFYQYCEENKCHNKNLDYYVRNGLVGRDKQQIKWIKTAKKMFEAADNCNNSNINAYRFLADKCYFDPEKKGLTEEEYLSLPDDYSTNDESVRKAVYQIYIEYEKFLTDNDLFDDTDLMLRFYRICNNEKKKTLVLADEVQDYTEIQLFILNKIKADNGCIFYCGDANQNVNPTLFREKKLKSMYSGNDLQIVPLNCSFRCTEPIVEIVRKMQEECRRIIGTRKEVSSLLPESERSGERPYRLSGSSSNLKQIIEEISSSANAFVLVPNNRAKQHLIDLFGSEKYKRDEFSFIFTVSEIKGMEIEYVLCYNLFGEFSDIWMKLFSAESFKKRTQFRYYFNLFNVASTRSQAFLGFIDDNTCNAIEEILDLDEVSSFLPDKLFLDRLKRDSESFIEAAKDFENNGKYDEAISRYKKAGKCEEDVIRCYAKKKEKEKEYGDAVAYYMLAGKDDDARRIMKKLSKSSMHFIISSFILEGKEAATGFLEANGGYVGIFNSVFNELEYAPDENKDLILLGLVEALKSQSNENISYLRKIGESIA